MIDLEMIVSMFTISRSRHLGIPILTLSSPVRRLSGGHHLRDLLRKLSLELNLSCMRLFPSSSVIISTLYTNLVRARSAIFLKTEVSCFFAQHTFGGIITYTFVSSEVAGTYISNRKCFVYFRNKGRKMN